MIISEQQRLGTGMTSQRTRDRLISRLIAQGISNPAVLDAIRNTPRHLFVDDALAHRAYEDTALPIGSGQTISQPYIVARMTEAILEDGIPEKVLEIGTGSGYQAAILSAVVPKVYSVERIRSLLVQAKQLFRRLHLRNVMAKHSDGSWGWPESGPYDAIIVTAAPEVIPDELLNQLIPGGRMIVPVGEGRSIQELQKITRTDNGFEAVVLEQVSFVPFLSGTA
ncbi:MAG: protein-L-isoaspartate(D-aspartate) O-methyltransferase [Gammaproteobacteria bacterium]|nr:MAG: protein-L-isoaspartate(D-aspartate) O-methyltransferase [Gammaproteobacteria bacterium]